MGTWNDVRIEMDKLAKSGHPDAADIVRRQKISQVEKLTGHPLVIYVSDFTDEGKVADVGGRIGIELNDKTGFAQALSDIPPGPIDILIHSPGGSPTATESIVNLIRASYNPVRFIVPHTVKSAATMLSLSGNEIIVSELTEFGPIDPQMMFRHEGRSVTVPAQAAIDQFNRANEEINRDSHKMAIWLPVLRQFGPSFLEECYKAIQLSRELVIKWLSSYMFAEYPDKEAAADKVATWLANHNNFNSHSRNVNSQQLLQLEPRLKIKSVNELDKSIKDAIMDLFWAIDNTFNSTTAYKIIEHTSGSAYIQQAVHQLIKIPSEQQKLTNDKPVYMNRSERRRIEKGKK